MDLTKTNIKIMFENELYVVCIKPCGVTSEDTDRPGMPTLLGGKSPYYTVHRLDREVGGVMVYAKTKECAADLSRQMTEGCFDKRYIAVIKGEMPEKDRLEDLLFRDRVKNKTFVVKRERAGVKKAALEYERVCSADIGGTPFSLVKIKLFTGRTHQIRVQFASRKHPLYGDRKYGSDKTDGFGLFSTSLSFTDPKGKKQVTFNAEPPSAMPWSAFDIFTENS